MNGKKTNVLVHVLMASCPLEVAAVSDRPPAVAPRMEPDRCLLVAQAATAKPDPKGSWAFRRSGNCM